LAVALSTALCGCFQQWRGCQPRFQLNEDDKSTPAERVD
jgi:hypothetical protein